MAAFRLYADFTAQSQTVGALMRMYARLPEGDVKTADLLPFVVFMAFSIESYVNSIGSRHVSIWDEVERLPWKQKVLILHKLVKRSPDWGRDPLQFALEVFRYRDRLAHGRSERVLGPVFTDFMEATRALTTVRVEPAWYSSITRDWVLKSKGRFHDVMVYLGALFNLHESDHLRHSTGGFLDE